MTIYGDTPGVLYILCFDRPIGNAANRRALASHYLGFTIDLPRRLAVHKAGYGQPLTAAAVKQGIAWTVYYRPGTPELERYLKGHYKNTPDLCPHCAGRRGRSSTYGFQPLSQLAFDLVEPLPDLPDPPALPMDGYEILRMRSWRATRAALAPAAIAGLDAVDVDIPF